MFRDNFVSETVIEEDWQYNFRMSRRSLYELADELRVNPNTCGRGQIRFEYGYMWI